jgi:hypothetical protein
MGILWIVRSDGGKREILDVHEDSDLIQNLNFLSSYLLQIYFWLIAMITCM